VHRVCRTIRQAGAEKRVAHPPEGGKCAVKVNFDHHRGGGAKSRRSIDDFEIAVFLAVPGAGATAAIVNQS
jgi:hypothetical protein